MSAKNEIAEILSRWLELTHKEGAAIQSARWPDVLKIQGRKTSLQKQLAQAIRDCANGVDAPGAAKRFLEPFRGQVNRIIAYLDRNRQALAAQLRQAQSRQAALDDTKRNLARIQRSYARPQSRAAWQAYT